jgi:hypothetical protein
MSTEHSQEVIGMGSSDFAHLGLGTDVERIGEACHPE